MATTEDVALTLRLPEALHEDLRKIAKREDRSLSWLIRFALKEFAAREGADATN
ncbi:MAG TPA: ribbon-helix-helix protein, CopG family [Solirubrobacteraceae bacterium]|nr:ribbon-helix-helix protein, CopG family [Solirubrobacteraceae bacterium]